MYQIRPVPSAVRREVEKRTKNNEKSSDFGWGPVVDTIPTVKKDLEETRKRIDAIIKELKFPPQQKLQEQEPPNKKNKSESSSLLVMWRDTCNENYEKGFIGLIPDCFHETGIPPLEDFMETSSGQIVLHVLQFLKQKL